VSATESYADDIVEQAVRQKLMQKIIEIDLMVLVMVFLKKFVCRFMDDSGLESITSAVNWLFGIHNSKKISFPRKC
jgi:hypothetical protein